MNGEVCCILGICCPPESEQRIEALAREVHKEGLCQTLPQAKAYARWMLKHFTLAPKSLEPFITEIVTHATAKPKHEKP